MLPIDFVSSGSRWRSSPADSRERTCRSRKLLADHARLAAGCETLQIENLPMVKRLIATLIMTSHLAACVSWQIQESAPQKASELRITLADGKRQVLRNAALVGDSIVGFAVRGQGDRLAPRERVAIPATDVRRIEQSRLSTGRTALAVSGLGVAIGLVVAVKNIQTTDPNH